MGDIITIKLAENAMDGGRRLASRQDDLETLTQAIKDGISHIHGKNYFGQLIDELSIEYINLKVKDYIEPEWYELWKDRKKIATTLGENFAFGRDLGIVKAKENKNQDIVLYVDAWEGTAVDLVETLIHELQHSHYSKLGKNPSEALSHHDTKVFKDAVRSAINAFGHSKEGKKWYQDIAEKYKKLNKHSANNKELSIDNNLEKMAMVVLDNQNSTISDKDILSIEPSIENEEYRS